MSTTIAFTASEESVIEMYTKQIMFELQNGSTIEALRSYLSDMTAPYILDQAFSRAINIIKKENENYAKSCNKCPSF